MYKEEKTVYGRTLTQQTSPRKKSESSKQLGRKDRQSSWGLVPDDLESHARKLGFFPIDYGKPSKSTKHGSITTPFLR